MPTLLLIRKGKVEHNFWWKNAPPTFQTLPKLDLTKEPYKEYNNFQPSIKTEQWQRVAELSTGEWLYEFIE